jgi:hypothetical protein
MKGQELRDEGGDKQCGRAETSNAAEREERRYPQGLKLTDLSQFRQMATASLNARIRRMMETREVLV